MTPSKESLQKLALRLMAQYTSLPEGRSGVFAVENEFKRQGDKLFIVNFREMIFSGIPQTDVVLTKPYTVQNLTENGSVWMSNLPCELVQMYREFAAQASGNVFIGGLGLGIVADMVHQKKNVSKVTVAELNPDVIRLNASRTGIEIVTGDVFDVLKATKPGEYSQAFFDTWQSDGEWTWQTIVVPLRRLSVGKFKRVICWHEDVMKGQVWQGIFRAADLPEDVLRSKSKCHWYAFRKAAKLLCFRNGPRIDPFGFGDIMKSFEIEEENKQDPELRYLASVLVNKVGTKQWEHFFGRAWDEACNSKEVQ